MALTNFVLRIHVWFSIIFELWTEWKIAKQISIYSFFNTIVELQDETELMEDSLALPGFPSSTVKFGSNEDDLIDSDDIPNSRSVPWSSMASKQIMEPNLISAPAGHIKLELRRRPAPQGWLQRMVFFSHSFLIFLLFNLLRDELNVFPLSCVSLPPIQPIVQISPYKMSRLYYAEEEKKSNTICILFSF